MWRIAVAAVALALTAVGVRAQQFTVEQALSYPFPSELTAAAQGERAAWVFDARGASNVWVAEGPGFAAHSVTHYQGDEGMPINSLRLTPDGRTVVYARGSETNGQGEVADPTSNVVRPEQQVWAANVDGGDAPRLLGTMNCGFEGCEDIQISPDGQSAVWAARGALWLAPVSGAQPARQLAYIRGNNSDPQWSPDSQAIAFVSNRGTHSLIGIYRVGASTLEYAAPSVFHDLMPRWSPDGQQLAFVRLLGSGGGIFFGRRPQPWTIWVWNAATKQARQVWQSTPDERGGLPGEWESTTFQFGSGNRVVFAAQEDGWVHLYSVPASGGAATLLTPGDFSIAPAPVTLTPDGETLLYASNQGDVDRRHVWKVSVSRPGPVALSHGDGLEWTPVATGDGRAVVCLGSTATQPAMPYQLTLTGRKMIASSALPADYPSAAMVVPRAVTFRSPDGLTIHGQLFLPRRHNRKLPALIFTHGGPPRQMMLGFHPMDAYNFMYAANQYLANHGYVVLSVNYRLSIMYGLAFRQPAHAGPQGASEYQDVVAGARYLQALPYVNPARIGLWGGSYGGYLTALGLARNSDIFKAGVDYAGVHDWRIGFGSRAGLSEAARQLAYESSPVASIDKWTSPVLLMQADDDRNVEFAQTVDLVHLLRTHHLPYELIVFPDGIHDSLLWQTWVRNFEATGAFFDRVLVRGEAVRPSPGYAH
ncbi:MAG: prolyl oligopeptidase family serine peptidase [Terriglobales bacterium]